MRTLGIVCALTILFLAAAPARAQTAQDYRQYFCDRWQKWVHIPLARGNADCVSPTHAIALSPASSYMQTIGRALTYATATGLRPGLILVCDSDQGNCLSYAHTAAQVLTHFSLGATVWSCNPIDRALSACTRTETGNEP